MAGSKVTISDFSIRVRLDTGNAAKKLKDVEDKLEKFSNSTGASKANAMFKRLSVTLAKVKRQFTTIKGVAGALVWPVKKTYGFLAGSFNTLKSMKTLLFTGLGFYAIARSVSFIYNRIKDITELGSKVQQSMLTMNAAISASDVASGLNNTALAQLQKGQRIFAEKLATTYGLSISKSMSNYAKFFAASSNYLGTEGSQGLFRSITQLGIVYGLSAEKMDRAMTAFTQMASKNQVMAEELKQQLGDVLPGSMEIFARAMTKMGKYGIVTVEKLYDLMAKGKIVASEVLPFVTKEMDRMSAGSLAGALKLLSTRMAAFRTSIEVFSTGALNQFDQTLGKIFDTLRAIFMGKGFQTKAGQWINNLLEGILSLLDRFSEGFKNFEEDFANAFFREDKKAVLETFWDQVFKNPVKGILEDLKKWFLEFKDTTLMPMVDTFSKAISEGIEQGIKNALSSFSILDLFGTDIGFGKLNGEKSLWDSIMKPDIFGTSMRLGTTDLTNPISVNVYGGINTEVSGQSQDPVQDAKDINTGLMGDIYDLIPFSTSTGAVV